MIAAIHLNISLIMWHFPLQVKKDFCSSFYQKRYTPDPIVHDAVNQLLSNLPIPTTLSQDNRDGLMRPIKEGEIEETLSNSARRKAAGLNGFPFEIHLLASKAHQPSSLES